MTPSFFFLELLQKTESKSQGQQPACVVAKHFPPENPNLRVFARIWGGKLKEVLSMSCFACVDP